MIWITLHCNTLQHNATHIKKGGTNGVPWITPHWNTLQHNASHCNTLEYTATHCNTLQRTATRIRHGGRRRYKLDYT